MSGIGLLNQWSMEKSLETCNSRVLLTSLNILYYEQWTLWRVMKNQWKNKRGLSSRESSIQLTLRRTRKFIPPSWYKGGGDGTPPRSFWYLLVFRNDFTFGGKPLISSTRWGIFYGWCRCWRPVTSPTMVAILSAWILPRIRSQVKTARNGDFFCALHET